MNLAHYVHEIRHSKPGRELSVMNFDEFQKIFNS